MATINSLQELRDSLRGFARMRGWDRAHSPKNLAAALSAQTGKVLERFRWLTEEQSAALPPEVRREVAAEIADALFYLVRLADTLDIDLHEAALDRLDANARRFPAPAARDESS